MTSLILLILFAVAVVIGALYGFGRGMNKAIVRLITLVVAAIATFFIAGPLTNYLAEIIIIDGKTLGETILEYINSDETVAGILEAAPLMKEAILVAPTFAMSIVVFPVLFWLLKFVTWFIFCFIQKPLRKLIFKERFLTRKEKKAKVKLPKAPFGIRVLKKFAGLGVGAVTGALIFGMLMLPFFGLVSVLPEQSAVDQLLDTMVEQGALTEDDANLIKGEYAAKDGVVIKLYTMLGATPAGRAYLNSVSRIEADGQVTYLPDEFDSLLSVLSTAVEGGLLDVLENADDTNAIFTLFADREFVDALMQDMFNSKLLRSAIPEVMAIAMESVAVSMNVPADKEAVYNNMMDDIAGAVKDADVDYDAIKAYESAKGRSYIDADDDGVMTEEEYEAEIKKLGALTEKIAAIIGKAVVGGNETMANSIADIIVRDVKTQAENGADALQSFDANAVKETISSISSSDVEAGGASAEEFLGKLTDPEKFETTLPTVETIKASIRETVKNAVADDKNSQATASTLASVVSNFAGAVSSATDAEGNIDPLKLDFNKIANAITDLQNSPLKGVGSSVLDIVASSDALGDNAMISGAIGAIKDGYNNGEEVGGAIGSAGALVGLVGSMNGEGGANEEAAVNSITSLINNLNPFTITLLEQILSDETLIEMGVPAEYTKPTFNVLKTLLTELMALQGSENYDKEVDAILSIYNLATKGGEGVAEDEAKKLINQAAQSDAIYNTIVSIGTSNPFGLELSESELYDFANDIQEAYEESPKTEKDKRFYNAIAKMFAVDDRIELN